MDIKMQPLALLLVAVVLLSGEQTREPLASSQGLPPPASPAVARSPYPIHRDGPKPPPRPSRPPPSSPDGSGGRLAAPLSPCVWYPEEETEVTQLILQRANGSKFYGMYARGSCDINRNYTLSLDRAKMSIAAGVMYDRVVISDKCSSLKDTTAAECLQETGCLWYPPTKTCYANQLFDSYQHACPGSIAKEHYRCQWTFTNEQDCNNDPTCTWQPKFNDNDNNTQSNCLGVQIYMALSAAGAKSSIDMGKWWNANAGSPVKATYTKWRGNCASSLAFFDFRAYTSVCNSINYRDLNATMMEQACNWAQCDWIWQPWVANDRTSTPTWTCTTSQERLWQIRLGQDQGARALRDQITQCTSWNLQLRGKGACNKYKIV